ncbi:hypothetical protein P171DRAFT_446898 [Karstenula rhodostoma CBS 690.94]|uniref:Uncharacterized protein n=1 Tax=Karstenula rhodostoma CBS 690.94 TaxID=1392251 RepID=A0A9P4PBG6_9PLEO|nr:hypothetical protein P171DRAFT_446898 [Karstenula rhodostoma CBS 690.94]
MEKDRSTQSYQEVQFTQAFHGPTSDHEPVDHCPIWFCVLTLRGMQKFALCHVLPDADGADIGLAIMAFMCMTGPPSGSGHAETLLSGNSWLIVAFQALTLPFNIVGHRKQWMRTRAGRRPRQMRPAMHRPHKRPVVNTVHCSCARVSQESRYSPPVPNWSAPLSLTLQT